MTSVAAQQAAEAARSWKSHLPSQRRHVSYARGIGLVLRSAIPYLMLFAGSFMLTNVWLRVACILSMPFAIAALFVVGHDAAHHTLTPGRRLNGILGRLCLLPAYHPFSAWCHAHIVLHHGGTCLKGKHPDYAPMSKTEFDALPAWKQYLLRLSRTPIGIGFGYMLDFYPRYVMFPKAQNRADRWLVLLFAGMQFWLGYHWSAATLNQAASRALFTAIAVLLPWAIWIYSTGVMSFVQHTHPQSVWYDDPAEWEFYSAQLRGSTHMSLAWPMDGILHHIMEHGAHHLDTTIPLQELPASQNLLEQQAGIHCVTERLTVRRFWQICSACKLYDYQTHRWLDFEGKATHDNRSG